MSNLSSNDYQLHGLYRAKLIQDNIDNCVRAYIPGLSSMQNPFDESGNIDEESFKKIRKAFPEVQWCCYTTDAAAITSISDIAWVMFENSNINYPVVINYTTGSVDASVDPGDDNPDNSGNPTDNLNEFKQSISSILSDLSESLKYNVAYYIKDLNNDWVVESNSSNKMPAASLMKLFVAAKIYDLGIHSSNNSDMKNMLGSSDNGAANRLIDKCDGNNTQTLENNTTAFNNINSYASSLGCNATEIGTYYGYAPYKSTDNSDGWYTNIFTSCKDCAILLEKLYNNNFISSEISSDFKTKINIASDGENDKFRKASNASNVTFYDKSGETTKIDNHVALVTSNNCNFIICLMVSQPKGSTSDIDTATVRKKFVTFFDTTYEYITVKQFETSGNTDPIDLSTLSDDASRIAEVAKAAHNYGISPQNGMCLKFVCDVYDKALSKTCSRYHCATEAGAQWCVSKITDSNKSTLPKGCAIFGYGNKGGSAYSNGYGHVGIYGGDGKVYHAFNYGNSKDTIINGNLSYRSLDDFLNSFSPSASEDATYNGMYWGWINGESLLSGYNSTPGTMKAKCTKGG